VSRKTFLKFFLLLLVFNFNLVGLYSVSVKRSTPSSSQNSLLLQVRKNLKNASPFFLNFRQQVFDDSDMITEESGNILFVDINRIKWVYNDPEYKVFLINKNKYEFYDKESNQLTKGMIKENRQKWIWQILFSNSIADEIVCHEEKKIISIKNKTDDIDLKVYIGRNGLPKKVFQQQGAGIKYIYFFENYKVKYKYKKNVFDLNLPKDVDIVNMERES